MQWAGLPGAYEMARCRLRGPRGRQLNLEFVQELYDATSAAPALTELGSLIRAAVWAPLPNVERDEHHRQRCKL